MDVASPLLSIISGSLRDLRASRSSASLRWVVMIGCLVLIFVACEALEGGF